MAVCLKLFQTILISSLNHILFSWKLIVPIYPSKDFPSKQEPKSVLL